jgi:hypothetical protein
MASALVLTGRSVRHRAGAQPVALLLLYLSAPLGLAEQRPLLANRRRAPAFWELVARGGRPWRQ